MKQPVNLFYVADLVNITLEKKQYHVTEGEGEVEVCATLISTYDVECAVPSDFQIYIASNATAGDSIMHKNYYEY